MSSCLRSFFVFVLKNFSYGLMSFTLSTVLNSSRASSIFLSSCFNFRWRSAICSLRVRENNADHRWLLQSCSQSIIHVRASSDVDLKFADAEARTGTSVSRSWPCWTSRCLISCRMAWYWLTVRGVSFPRVFWCSSASLASFWSRRFKSFT